MPPAPPNQRNRSVWASRLTGRAAPTPQAALIVVVLADLVSRFTAPLAAQLRLFLAPQHLYAPVKAAILAAGSGPRHAAAAPTMTTRPLLVVVVAAVLTNHVRRVLAPGLGQFLWRHPVQVMKLASTTPHYFVEEQLRVDEDGGGGEPAALCLWVLQTAALAVVRQLVRHRLCGIAAGASAHRSQTQQTRASHAKHEDDAAAGTGGTEKQDDEAAVGPARDPCLSLSLSSAETAPWRQDLCRLLYLALCLMRIEYACAETFWAASWIHAVTHIALRGTAAERRFTYLVVLTAAPAAGRSFSRWRPLLLTTALLFGWLRRAVWQPCRRHGVATAALSGLGASVALVGAATAHVIRYSNKYFIWLEMSEMLLTWVWLVLGLALVAAWRLGE